MARQLLIIEDDRAIAELEKDYLDMAGFQAELTTNGKDGLTKALIGGYDMLLVDIMLPGCDGFEIVRKIREHSEIPILLVSAKKDDIDKIRGLGLGANDYIVKPFSPNELVARVKAHLARYDSLMDKSEREAPAIEIGSLVIEPQSRRVFESGNEIVLTNKEFDLLVFLAGNPNRVFSKDDLFDKVWGMDAFGDASTVTVHINRIRDKLAGAGSRNQYIETIWGAGYRFNI